MERQNKNLHTGVDLCADPFSGFHLFRERRPVPGEAMGWRDGAWMPCKQVSVGAL